MRTFLAIPLPAEARVLLAEVQTPMRAFRADVKWTAVESIHLTLKFLGEIDPATLPALSEQLRKEVAAEKPFTLRIRGLGGFPNLRNPRVLWIGLDGDLQRLSGLQQRVEAVCTRVGFSPEERPFQPHLTLGRVRGKSNLQALIDYIKIAEVREHTFGVTQFHAYQSTLRPQGAFYTLQDKIELKGT